MVGEKLQNSSILGFFHFVNVNFEQKSGFVTDANPKNSGFCTSIGPEIENIFQQLKARIYTYTEKVIL